MAPSHSFRPTLQAMDAMHLFEVITQKLDWSDVSNDVIMDIGCGSDRNCCNLLVTLYPEVEKVIAIDAMKCIIKEATVNFPHHKMEYQIADIENRSSLERWKEKISKVVSVNCFNCLTEQKKAFQNLYYILKPGGEAAILFNVQSGYYDWFIELAFESEWKEFFEGVSIFIPDSHYTNHDAEYFRSLLEDVGFNVLWCQLEDRTYSYSSDDSCRDGGVKACPFSHNIPNYLRGEFKEESFQIFLNHNGRDADGNPCLKYRSICALISKPAEPNHCFSSMH